MTDEFIHTMTCLPWRATATDRVMNAAAGRPDPQPGERWRAARVGIQFAVDQLVRREGDRAVETLARIFVDDWLENYRWADRASVVAAAEALFLAGESIALTAFLLTMMRRTDAVSCNADAE